LVRNKTLGRSGDAGDVEIGAFGEVLPEHSGLISQPPTSPHLLSVFLGVLRAFVVNLS